MNPRVKEEWLRRLRSGEIKQAQKRLRRADNSMCCLGVLTEIAVDKGLIPAPRFDHENQCYRYEDRERTTSVVLPSVVQDWAGLLSENPFVKARRPHPTDGHMVDTLAAHNDAGATFAEIADIIEKEF